MADVQVPAAAAFASPFVPLGKDGGGGGGDKQPEKEKIDVIESDAQYPGED